MEPEPAPEPEPGRPAPAAAAAPKGMRILACVLCQNRKIKCDRTTPCSNCVKANVTCTPSTPAPARKRRRPNQDLQERLARCEALIKQYAGGSGPAELPITPTVSAVAIKPKMPTVASPPASSPTTPAASASAAAAAAAANATTPTATSVKSPSNHDESPYLHWKPAGKIESGNGGSKFVESHLFASLYKELTAMKSILDDDEIDEQTMVYSDTANTPDDGGDLIMAGSPYPNVDSFFPDPVHVFQLWQVYIDRVNPITKLIHVPSIQPYMVQVTSSPTSLPLSVQALLFSIFCLAVVSLDDLECQRMIGQSRDALIARYSSGTKASLCKSNFMAFFDMHTVQALSIHLLSLQSRYSRDAMWIINGVVIRISQKLGFHRDGETLGLSPFETEMQRRIWWHVVMQDAKLAMQSGLSHSHLPATWDTKPPSNLNDADIVPGATEPVRPREGPTEMGFCMLAYRMAEFIVGSQGNPGYEIVLLGQEIAELADPSVANAESISNYRTMLSRLDQDLLELERKYVDAAAGSVHVLARMFRPMVMEKIWSLMVPIREQAEWGTEIFSSKDNLFKVTVMTMYHAIRYYDVLTELGFLWFVKIHMQVDVFAVILGQLCQRTRGSLVDRAWEVVDKTYHYHKELHDMSQRNNLSLGTFALKAWKNREQVLRQIGQPIVVPDCILLLRDLMPCAAHGTPSDVSGGGNSSATGSRPPTAIPSNPSSTSLSVPTTSPAMGSPPIQAKVREDRGLDQILNDTWGMNGIDWTFWMDPSNIADSGRGGAVAQTAATVPNQQSALFGFGGGTSNGFGW